MVDRVSTGTHVVQFETRSTSSMESGRELGLQSESLGSNPSASNCVTLGKEEPYLSDLSFLTMSASSSKG